ncbi:unnamed protein product, partial [Ranitomeya imitator]
MLLAMLRSQECIAAITRDHVAVSRDRYIIISRDRYVISSHCRHAFLGPERREEQERRRKKTYEETLGWRKRIPSSKIPKPIILSVCGYLIMHIVQSLFGLFFVYAFVFPIKHGQALQVLKGFGISLLLSDGPMIQF